MKDTYTLMAPPSSSSQHTHSINHLQGQENQSPKLRGVFHLLGAIITIPATFYLLDHAKHQMDDKWTAALIYSLSLFLLMSCSALYHIPRWSSSKKAMFRRLDHSMIYILIAGTLVPFFSVLGEHCPTYIVLLIVVNTSLGVLRSLFMKTHNRSLRVISYVIMSFITFLLIPKIYTILGLVITAWLLLGGFLYGIGAYIYTIKKPNPIPNVLEYHEVFHIFVNLASICHFISIWHSFSIPSL